MPVACQDLLAPGFLQNGPNSLDALGKKRHTQQMAKSLSVRVAGSTRGSLKPQRPSCLLAGWHPNGFGVLFQFQCQFAGGQALYIGVP